MKFLSGQEWQRSTKWLTYEDRKNIEKRFAFLKISLILTVHYFFTPFTMTAQETKKTEISIFSENDKAISEIMATSKTLVITDLEDKEQYDKVHNQRMALVKMRTQGIDPKEEELTNPLK
jgi:hypothetical protein